MPKKYILYFPIKYLETQIAVPERKELDSHDL